MKRPPLTIGLTLLLLLLLAACGRTGPEETAVVPGSNETAPVAPAPDEYTPAALAAFVALPEVAAPTDYELTDEIIELGRLLYYEERISISQELSCNSCHLLDQYGVDGLQFSLGHDGVPVGRNSPTVYNAALHVAQFWDGRAADVEEQAQGPILASGEMGMPDPDYVIYVLNTIPGYLPLFEAAFPGDPEPINYDNVGRAIGAFERKLITPGRFDALLNGDENALNEQEKRGLALFVSTGCTTCHYGDTIGGKRYAIMGQVHPYPDLADEGRFIITGNEADMFSFKVPSLLNIAETGPYLHDGSIISLEEMVRLMAFYQLDRELTDTQVTDITAFMKALTGEIPWDYIAVPEFPPNGPDTPGPYEYEASSN
jgi:cytochrome c peroxidase